jgi:transposase
MFHSRDLCYDGDMRPHGSAQSLEHRRLEAVRLHGRGFKPSRIALQLGATRQSVNRWLRGFRRKGRAALAARRTPGRPARLTAQLRRQLAKLLIRGPVAAGFSTNLWTCPRIALVLRQQLGVNYHVDYLPRLLRSLGFTCQKPESSAIERDEKAIKNWVRRDWARIKKRRPTERPHRFHR